MSCRFCGTLLPPDAMFCGECGRAVAVRGGASSPGGIGPMPLAFSSADAASDDPADHVGAAHGGASCPQCGASVEDDEVFCGECGFVLRRVAPPPPPGPPPLDDVPIEPDLRREVEFDGGFEADLAREVEFEAELEPDLDFEPEPPAETDLPGEPEPPAAPDAAPDVSPTDVIPALEPDLELGVERAPRPDPFPWGRAVPQIEDIEATRLVADPFAGERFVLQFSTGENVTVRGQGLIGRNPGAEPGEVVDQLVAVFDPTKSVSKTHLEFGQESGRFWVSDRFSTNGSVVRQPDADPQRCDPGKRYFIARGTRVDIGEQFFVVS